MSLRAWRRVRLWGAAAVLAAIVWRLGTGPFRDGIGAVDARVLAVGLGIGLVTTVCCAWRWTVVARGLGIELSLPAAVAAYYRSIFLNLTLPGGVVGDVHRGVRHGRDAGDVGRGLRAVAWERTAGQVVQALLTLAVLLALPSPVRTFVVPIAIGVAGATIGVGLLLERARPRRRSWWARARRGIARDVRAGLLARGALPVVALTSALVVIGHALTFLVAARAAGVSAPPARMLPLALLAMLGMVVPGIAGWGPREGATAWVFGAAGLGAGQGVATAVVYGVMVLVAALPGALVLLGGRFEPPLRALVAGAKTDGVADA
ncbi:MAG TPA: lysylphosphatidylglycerol synthase transmembrane domain-containing protein [Gaiellales bacterium]|nr:lysylphosphatidylglycerol synthase transmembrane domain-containing protein [Gaiellales bacterium]